MQIPLRPLLRRRRATASLLASGLLAVALSTGVAVPAHAATAPADRLPMRCSEVITKATLAGLFGQHRWISYNTRARPSASPEAALGREAGLLACSWSTAGSSLDVNAIAGGAQGFRAAKRTLGVGAEVRKHSAARCSGDSMEDCTVELLVHGVWVEARFTGGVPADDDFDDTGFRFSEAHYLTKALRHAFRHGAATPAWHRSKRSWAVPASCSALDPQNAVGAVAGIGDGTVEVGENGNDNAPGALAQHRTGFTKCTWWSADTTTSVSATILPGASWAHPAGRHVAAKRIGSGARRVTQRTEHGWTVIDVVGAGGWVEIRSNRTPNETRAAALVLTGLLAGRG